MDQTDGAAFSPSIVPWLDPVLPVPISRRRSVSTPATGAATHDVAESIHRPLTLTVLTLTPLKGGTPLVLVDADLGWWKTPQTFQNFQGRLLEVLSLPSGNRLWSSHTHAGPPLMEPDDSLPGSSLLRAWMEHLFESTVATVRQAIQSQCEATLDWQQGRCGLATVRDSAGPGC